MLTGGDYTDKASRRARPRVWAVASYRAGENSQIFGLANRLGGDVATKRLRYNALRGRARLDAARLAARHRRRRLRCPRSAVARRRSFPPGLKNEPVCRWIKQCSGGRTRLVFLGRTWARRDEFDLVITTPQYRLPREPNVVHNLMTQHGVVRNALAADRARWEARFAQLPRPMLGVLIGGDSGPFVLGARAARRLADTDRTRWCGARGGSAIITTSARTRVDVADVLEAALTVPASLHRYRRDDPDNPYFGILALADAFVVTSDSVAMLSEAAATDAPVHIFDLGGDGARRARSQREVGELPHDDGAAAEAAIARHRPVSRCVRGGRARHVVERRVRGAYRVRPLPRSMRRCARVRSLIDSSDRAEVCNALARCAERSPSRAVSRASVPASTR